MLESKKGLFVALEGLDGSGKTTIQRYITDLLLEHNITPVITRAPGGSEFGAKVRALIMDEAGHGVDGLTEALLFATDRHYLNQKIVIPAIGHGQVVLCDRWLHSSIAYQGDTHASWTKVQTLSQLADGPLTPDFVLYFDVSVENSILRVADGSHETNRLDLVAVKRKEAILAAYDAYYRWYAGKVETFNANQPLDDLKQQVRAWVLNVLIPAHNIES